MKKFLFTLVAVIFFTLGANAYNYNSISPSNTFGGRNTIIQSSPTVNGSAQTYRDMLKTNNRRYAYPRRMHNYGSPNKHHGRYENGGCPNHRN